MSNTIELNKENFTETVGSKKPVLVAGGQVHMSARSRKLVEEVAKAHN